MAKQLRALAALSKVLSSVSTHHMVAHNHLTLVPEVLMPSSDLCRHACGTHNIPAGKTLIHIITKLFFKTQNIFLLQEVATIRLSLFMYYTMC